MELQTGDYLSLQEDGRFVLESTKRAVDLLVGTRLQQACSDPHQNCPLIGNYGQTVRGWFDPAPRSGRTQGQTAVSLYYLTYPHSRFRVE